MIEAGRTSDADREVLRLLPGGAQVVVALNKTDLLADKDRLLQVCQEILPLEDLQGKDTESYYNVLYQGKSNRWLVRFWGDKKRPALQFGIPLTDAHRAEIKRARMELGSRETVFLDKPENLQRLAGLLADALNFCKNDENFKRKTEVV